MLDREPLGVLKLGVPKAEMKKITNSIAVVRLLRVGDVMGIGIIGPYHA